MGKANCVIDFVLQYLCFIHSFWALLTNIKFKNYCTGIRCKSFLSAIYLFGFDRLDVLQVYQSISSSKSSPGCFGQYALAAKQILSRRFLASFC